MTPLVIKRCERVAPFESSESIRGVRARSMERDMARHANAWSEGEPVELRRGDLVQARLSPGPGQAVESETFTGSGGHARPNGRQVGYLHTAEVASLLGVSPNILREWERRYAFPRPRRLPGGGLLFAEVEIAALQDALRDSMSVCGALARARAQVDARASPSVPSRSADDRRDGSGSSNRSANHSRS